MKASHRHCYVNVAKQWPFTISLVSHLPRMLKDVLEIAPSLLEHPRPHLINTTTTKMSIKPPFLFRAASKQSRGINTTTEIDPLAGYEWKYHADMASINYPDLRQMVHDHIKFIYKSPSEFSSWSVSPLYVLVHAVRCVYEWPPESISVGRIQSETVTDQLLAKPTAKTKTMCLSL